MITSGYYVTSFIGDVITSGYYVTSFIGDVITSGYHVTSFIGDVITSGYYITSFRGDVITSGYYITSFRGDVMSLFSLCIVTLLWIHTDKLIKLYRIGRSRKTLFDAKLIFFLIFFL